MIETTFVLILIGWLLCGILAYGWATGNEPHCLILGPFSRVLFGLTGPVGVLLSLLLSLGEPTFTLKRFKLWLNG